MPGSRSHLRSRRLGLGSDFSSERPDLSVERPDLGFGSLDLRS